jgi:hypothetical protein
MKCSKNFKMLNLFSFFPQDIEYFKNEPSFRDRILEVIAEARHTFDYWKLSIATCVFKVVYGENLLTKEEWYRMKGQWIRLSRLKTYDNYAHMALHMKILAAPNVAFTTEGLVFENKNEQGQAMDNKPPVQRSF